jgi:hypothetical protein
MNSMTCDVLVIGHGLYALVVTAAAGGRLVPGREIRRVVRRGRSISAIALDHGEISARFFVDTSAGLSLAGQQTFEPIAGREYIDTIAVAEEPGGRCALTYRAVLASGIDNALILPSNLPPALALATAHAVGTAAALLARTGQPADQLDSATLRERLRAAGARL